MLDTWPGVLKLRADWLRVVLLGLLLCARPAFGLAVTIFSTDFEYDEGYSTNALTLAGQNGWLSSGSGGNGVLGGYFIPGHVQTAYIGYDAPNPGDSFLSVWHPLNYPYPVASNTPVVVFSTLMAVVPPDIGGTNAFYWSLYNAQGDRLFVLDFDDITTNVFYAISGTNDFLLNSGWAFTSDAYGPVTITMNFASNRWSATLYSTQIITNQPITTGTNELSLGYLAAEWAINNVASPGDDYMLFNDYQVTATPIPAPLLRATLASGTNVSIRVSSETNDTFVVEASPNLLNWSAVNTNVTTTDGYFDFTDTNAVARPARYYRARWVP